MAMDVDTGLKMFWGLLAFYVLVKLATAVRVVPTKSACIVERLGKYRATLGPGFHTLLPFLDKVVYIRDLKEMVIDVPPQACFTRDEVKVEVDGVIYLSVVDPVKASYGVVNYGQAAIQLAQTTTRSVIGTLDLDRTFEERNLISARVVDVLDQAGLIWGIRVHRYEIKNITPPATVHKAMEAQVTAERNRRAIVAKSEGDRQSRINLSEGQKGEAINRSEGEMQRMINEAQGQAAEILAIARATASSIEKVAAAIEHDGGAAAVRWQLADAYLERLAVMAKSNAKIFLPADLTDVDGLLRSLDPEGELDLAPDQRRSHGGSRQEAC
ncbi:MAG: stomatin-like protein [Rhodospirillaceae bacterium]